MMTTRTDGPCPALGGSLGTSRNKTDLSSIAVNIIYIFMFAIIVIAMRIGYVVCVHARLVLHCLYMLHSLSQAHSCSFYPQLILGKGLTV